MTTLNNYKLGQDYPDDDYDWYGFEIDKNDLNPYKFLHYMEMHNLKGDFTTLCQDFIKGNIGAAFFWEVFDHRCFIDSYPKMSELTAWGLNSSCEYMSDDFSHKNIETAKRCIQHALNNRGREIWQEWGLSEAEIDEMEKL